MRLTEEQMQKKLLEKVQKDYNDFLDSLLDGDREMLGNNVQELSIKRDMMLEFEYFPPLDGDNLKAILRKKHPLDYLYKQWDKQSGALDEDIHWAIVEIAEQEAERLEIRKSDPER